MKWLSVALATLVAAYILYLAMTYAGFANVQLRNAESTVAKAMGYGADVTIPPGTALVAIGGSYAIRPSSVTAINITDYTCLLVSNNTWWWEGCGPTTLAISPGTYTVATRRYPSLQMDYLSTLLLLPLLFVLGIAAYYLYERRR